MSDDIVAELDRWLEGDPPPLDPKGVMQLARDEIVALREEMARAQEAVVVLTRSNIDVSATARAEALEEAARTCEAYAVQAEEDGKTDKADYSANINTGRRLMFLIRALKEKS